MELRKADRCRGCGSARLILVHDFGEQPLAGRYPTQPESRLRCARYPLDLSKCADCSLLQVLHLPPIEEIFHDDYRYSSSTVPGLVRHFKEYADWLKNLLPVGADIFEFGCNDGVLLIELTKLGFRCAGIDASNNVAAIARQKGLDVSTGFLTPDFVEQAGLAQRFDLVTCSNVFAHIHQIGSTLDAVRCLLRPRGMFAVEVHNGELLHSTNQFDTVYHEHLTYFTEPTLRALLERNGFQFVACLRTSMHGGGLRCIVRKADEFRFVGRTSGETDREAGDFIGPVIARCEEQLAALVARHGPLDGYGAAGRSQMFINFTESKRLFRRVFDDSGFRQGRYIVGTDIPIEPYDARPGECVVILAWNYADDIAAKVHGSFRRVVTLLPELTEWS
jgi:SAM-dependent methyltransferase